MTALINYIITRKRLPKMRMEALFVAAHAAAPKGNRVEQSSRVFCHKIKAPALHAFMHCSSGRIIVRWLACNIAKIFQGKVSVEHKELAMVLLPQAWVAQDSVPHSSKCKLGGKSPPQHVKHEKVVFVEDVM
jgi:hypothetical protein